MDAKPKIIFVLGLPGSGKGTQCDLIKQNYGFGHLSAGDLLKEERDCPGSKFGETINEYLSKTQIVPAKITVELLKNKMMQMKKEQQINTFLIDGFPRNMDNLEVFNEHLADLVELIFVLVFDCSEEECLKRCLARGRADDSKDVIKKRSKSHKEETLPVIDHYKSMNLVKTINSSQDRKIVDQAIRAILNESQI